MKDVWQVVKGYLFSAIGLALGFWTLFNWLDWSKFNQILLTIYILMLIHYKRQEKHGKKPKKGWIAKFYRWLIGKESTIKILNVSDKAEIQVESLLNFTEKIRKEGMKDMRTVKNAFKSFGRILRANKLTLLGDTSIIGVYYVLVEDLLQTYGFTLTNQPKAFYVHLIAYTIGFIIALFAMNGKGLERVEQFLSRVNFKNLNTIVDELIGLSVTTNAELVKKKLDKASLLLEKVEPYIQEKQYLAIKKSLDNVATELKRYNAKLILEKKREEEELLRIAERELGEVIRPQVKVEQPQRTEQPQRPQRPSEDRPRL